MMSTTADELAAALAAVTGPAVAAATSSSGSAAADALVLQALKERIREQDQLLQKTPRCLVCLSSYDVPLVSIQCWHVHCERCWLQVTGLEHMYFKN